MTKKNEAKGESSTSYLDLGGQKMDMKSIMKDIESLGSRHMTWKEKKALENKKVVNLGGKPPKKHRMPLSVAKFSMKTQKDKEQKRREESLILGKFGGYCAGSEKPVERRRRPEDRVLMSTGGHFRKGVLDVKHLLRPSAPRDNDDGGKVAHRGMKKHGGKKNHGKKKQSGGRKRR